MVGGYGTSPKWGSILPSIQNKNLLIRYDSSGMGPSDHASFYLDSIPVLFFFTGIHADYHKATDDWDKLREIRNIFSHEYPDSLNERIQNIKLALNGYELMINLYKKLKEYSVKMKIE